AAENALQVRLRSLLFLGRYINGQIVLPGALSV
ncbi:MAG: hypothetical protein JWO91_2772, partial [Acidobacteriaceae bacterium]|nr:hypothetical protein [Acidobacteriaceae bacterium]